ncbi:hypothetical protein Trydic_g2922 [Trypoxylus dichotomus]
MTNIQITFCSFNTNQAHTDVYKLRTIECGVCQFAQSVEIFQEDQGKVLHLKQKMDFETGEGPELVDQETGEIPGRGLLDSETGEVELLQKQPNLAMKRLFKVPARYMKPIDITEQDKAVTKKVGCGNASPFSPMFFLFPSVFFFMPIMGCILSVLEIVMHAWAHRKNACLRSKGIHFIRYQSPMHGLVSEFCAACRYESAKETIGKLQDRCNRRFIKYSIEWIKQIA